MARKRVKNFLGVYYRESQTRKHRGKPDRCFDIAYRDPFGKLVWEKVGWASEGYSAALASEIRGERLKQKRHSDFVDQKDTTLAQAWERFREWIEANSKRPQDDISRYECYLRERWSHLPLAAISPLDLEKLKADLLNKGLSPQTVTHALNLVQRIFNKASEWGLWTGQNPVSKVKKPRFDSGRIRFFSREEASELLGALHDTNIELHDMALLSLHTGMRSGEIRALRWGMVDMTNEIIHVAASGDSLDTKNYESRIANMTEAVKAALAKYERPAQQYVFLNQHGEPHRDIPTTFKRVVARLGFNDGETDRRQRVTFHTLRHTFASWLAIEGTPILTIKSLMGHKSLAMTEKYAKLIPDTRRQAVLKVFK
jgi:integrase